MDTDQDTQASPDNRVEAEVVNSQPLLHDLQISAVSPGLLPPVVLPPAPAVILHREDPAVQSVPVVQQAARMDMLSATALDNAQVMTSRLHRDSRLIIEDCQEFIEMYEHVVMNPVTLEFIDRKAEGLISQIDNMRRKLSDSEEMDEVDTELRRGKTGLKKFMAAALNKIQAPEPQPVTVQPTVQDSTSVQTAQDSSAGLLDMTQSDLEYFMARLRPNLMPDASYGTLLSNKELRELHSVVMPQISRTIEDCRKTLNSYTRSWGYDKVLAMKALSLCQDAADWVKDVAERYRERKLHLDVNSRHKIITFEMFKPGGEVSIYEFMAKFEAWSEDYLSEEAKADQLFNRFLAKSITENYIELTPLRHSFNRMKDWLFKKFGNIISLANKTIKGIQKLLIPEESHVPETVKYLCHLHKILIGLLELEISKGQPVPRLRSYLGSHAFLSPLIDALPSYITDKFFEDLVKKGIEGSEDIEGEEHLSSLLNLIKTKIKFMEFKARKSESLVAGVGESELPLATASPLYPLPTKPQASYWNRWACPIRDHTVHDVSMCAEFWNLSPQERRDSCRHAGCYTCLDRSGDCRGGCHRYHEVPAELICTDCAQSTGHLRAPPIVLFCGLSGHAKPDSEELTTSLEEWIPNLDIQSLGTAIRVHHTCVLNTHSVDSGLPEVSAKTKPSRSQLRDVVFDTTSGDCRQISHMDTVVQTSEEQVFFTMQTIRIKHEEVIVLYDSGSNAHLIEGKLAESLKLEVSASKGAIIGGLGGSASRSEYGVYSITLGSDTSGTCHQLKMQGVPSITSPFPEVDLKKLWTETRSQLMGHHILPEKIGGARARILIGIKSTQLVPKLKFSQPNGLGIYESALTDIYGSNICFGGPHSVFTEAYKIASSKGMPFQVVTSELVEAFVNAPRCYVRAGEYSPTLAQTHKQSKQEGATPVAPATAPAEVKELKVKLMEQFAGGLSQVEPELKQELASIASVHQQEICSLQQRLQGLANRPVSPVPMLAADKSAKGAESCISASSALSGTGDNLVQETAASAALPRPEIQHWISGSSRARHIQSRLHPFKSKAYTQDSSKKTGSCHGVCADQCCVPVCTTFGSRGRKQSQDHPHGPGPPQLL